MEVIKIGGAAGVEMGAFCSDLAQLRKRNEEIVVIHGGSEATNTISARLGKPPRMLVSPSGHEGRYTDAETLSIFTMVCAGKVNKDLVQGLQAEGINAVGLSGLDGRLVAGRRKTAIRAVGNGKVKVIRDDYSGIIEQVNTHLVKLLLQAGYLPVIGPPALGGEGKAINVDADRMAAAVAVGLGASRLIFLSNVPGLLRDPDREDTLIAKIAGDQLPAFRSFARGRMGKKLLAAQEALAGGVAEVILGDARRAEPIIMARQGKGTVIR